MIIHSIMPVNYQQVISESRNELKQWLKQRDNVDKRILELTTALRALVRFVPDEAQREQILQEVKDARRKQPSLTEAIFDILSRNKEGLNAKQIREELEQSGFDIEEYSQPLGAVMTAAQRLVEAEDRKSTRLNSSHTVISYAVF